MSPRNAIDRPARTADTFSTAHFVAGIVLLSFVTGAALCTFKLFPYQAMQRARRGAKAAFAVVFRRDDDRSTQAWHACRYEKRGLLRHDPRHTSPGFTLYTSAHAPRAFLLDMDGRVVHAWHLPYESVWDRSAAPPRPPLEKYIYWRKAKLLPNGDLMAIYVEAGMTPWGLGIVKIDRSSRLVWKYLGRVHHDFWLADDHRVFTLTHAIRHTPLAGVPGGATPLLEDFVVVLSDKGEEVRRISVYEALARSPYRPILERAPWNEHGDFLHTNAIELLEGTHAAPFAASAGGQILLSMREICFIGVLDTITNAFTWGTTGPWLEQHDPDILENGHLLLFDNLGRIGKPGGRSRVLELDPLTHGIVWSFEGSKHERFSSEVRSSQQRLPNGNTLITESDAGRLIEVTAEKRIVWEYVNPATRRDRPGHVPAVCWATRIPEAELQPEFAALLRESLTKTEASR